VVTGDPKADKPHEEEINGVQVIRWPTWAPSGAYHIPNMRSQLRNFLQKLLRAAAAARRTNPDVRIVFTPHYHGTGHSALRRLLWIPWRRYVARAVEAADLINKLRKELPELEIIQQQAGQRLFHIVDSVKATPP
jgi:hypothetical protein